MQDWFSNREKNVYEFIYRLTGKKELDPGLPDGTVFTSIEQLKTYLMGDSKDGYTETYHRVAFFLESEHKLKPAVYGWMKTMGYEIPGFD